MKAEDLLQDILNDGRSGSSRIIKRTLDLLGLIKEGERKEAVKKIMNAHPSMAGISRILEMLDKKDIGEIKREFENMDDTTVENLLNLTENKSVVVISRSHTVERGLDVANKVYVLYSEPGGEGRDTEKYLHARGINSILIPDSCMGYAVRECDLVVVGADTILCDGFVNKVGTLPLALTAKHFGKGFYVASPSYKLAEDCLLKIPFEFVPAELVDSFVCERGLYSIEEVWNIFKNKKSD